MSASCMSFPRVATARGIPILVPANENRQSLSGEQKRVPSLYGDLRAFAITTFSQNEDRLESLSLDFLHLSGASRLESPGLVVVLRVKGAKETSPEQRPGNCPA